MYLYRSRNCFKQRDADMKALFDKHDQEIGTLLNNLTATNTRVTVIETKQEC
jgi:hypothetical protein